MPREPDDNHPRPDRSQDPPAGHLAGRGGRRRRLPLRLRLLGGQRRRRRHQGRVRAQRGRDRLRRGRRPPRLRGGRLPGRQGRRPLRPHPGHEDRCAAVPGQRDRHGLRLQRVGPHLLAPRRRPGHRPGLRDRPGLHLRDLPAPRPRTPGLAPAARHHHRYLRRPALRRPVRELRRRRRPGPLVRHRGLALDVPRRRRPRRRVRLDCLHPARVAAVPGVPGQGRGSPQGLPVHRPGRGHGPPPARHQDGHRGGQGRGPEGLPARQGASACSPWCGSASSCRCCSSSSAST